MAERHEIGEQNLQYEFGQPDVPRPVILLRTPCVREVLAGEEPLGKPWSEPEPGVRRTFNAVTREFTQQEIIVQRIARVVDI